MSETVESRLAGLGIVLPPAPPAVAAYAPWVRFGTVIVTSGQLPWQDGKMAFAGKLGADLSDEQGYQAARLCAVNAIAQLKAAVGDLDKIRQVVRLEGNVHSAAGYQGQPRILNGASDLINAAFGERGRHTRTAIGVADMPLNAAVQLSLWAEVEA